MAENWKPDPQVMEYIKRSFTTLPDSYRLGFLRSLSNEEFYQEIVNGTEFGREIYSQFAEIFKEICKRPR